MSQADEAWNEVGEQFKKLGSMFKQHFETEPEPSVSEDEVKEAVHTLGESIKTAFSAFGDAVTDPELQEEARQTAGSFFDALGTTFSEVGAEISERREQDEDSS